jgi:hypothetical protein
MIPRPGGRSVLLLHPLSIKIEPSTSCGSLSLDEPRQAVRPDLTTLGPGATCELQHDAGRRSVSGGGIAFVSLGQIENTPRDENERSQQAQHN